MFTIQARSSLLFADLEVF
jgi:glycosyltransferase involved in cell wall biosynthesis